MTEQNDKHGDQEVLERIRNAVGKPVSFQYPGNEGHKKGKLKDRAIVASNPGATGVSYWDVVDLISFDDESKEDWIRIGYYRKPKEDLVWGSQTTITEPISVWKQLLVEAAKEKDWFRKLLEDVAGELKE